MRVTISAFPRGYDKHKKEAELSKHLSDLNKSLTGLSRVTLQNPITTTFTTYNMEKIEELGDLITYSLLLLRGTFKLCLQFKKNKLHDHL